MLALVTKARDSYKQRYEAELELRKRLEVDKRELERKIRMGTTTASVETRKTKDVAKELARKTDELDELKRHVQGQAVEIASLTKVNAAKDKRLHELEKRMSHYDDSFHSLEARSVRDRMRVEEMGKAKAKAEEERRIYRTMLESAHERALKERQELRRDAQAKLEASSARARAKRQKIASLEKELKERAQVEEEKNAYKEQCMALMEQCSELMQQLQEATGENVQLPVVQASAAAMQHGGGAQPGGAVKGNIWERMKSGVRLGVERAKSAVNEEIGLAPEFSQALQPPPPPPPAPPRPPSGGLA